MAKGVELASAYVSLSVSTDGIPQQVRKALNGSTKDVQQAGTRMGTVYSSALGSSAASGMVGHGRGAATKFGDGFQSEAERRGARVGTAVGTVIGKSIGGAITLGLTAATAGLTAAVGGIGYTLFKGFDRYKSLDASAKRLGALGKNAEQVKTIMSDINDVVEGTPIALDAATDSATKFITAGMDGKQLKKTLTAIADAAGASGADFEDLATIFGQVNNKGKLMGEEISQLAEHGLNVMPLLRQQFKDLPEDVGDAGLKIGDLVDVVEGKFGGMAKNAANTIDGSISQMQTAVARVGANFLSALFGDPLSTTEGPGGMAEAINKVTARIDELNGWVAAHQGEIKQFFTDASETVKGLWNNLKEVGTWLVDNKSTIATIGTVFAGWKVAGLLTDLGKVGGLLGGVGAGGKGGSGILGQLGLAVILAAEMNQKSRDGADVPDNRLSALGLLGGGAAVGSQFGPLGTAVGTAAGGGLAIGQAIANDHGNFADQFNQLGGPSTNASGTVAPGTNPLDVIAGKGGAAGNTPGGGSLDNLLAPFNPDNANTNGVEGPATADLQSYVRNQLGFTGTLGGWSPPDGFNEHSSGKATDIMVGNNAAQGYAMLPNVLARPGVEYVIWQNKMWYPDGTSKPYSGYGPNPTPTQMHMDHLHVKTYDQGGWLPPGMTLTNNETGKPELILNPEQAQNLAQSGIDPNTTMHGAGNGTPILPGPGQPADPANFAGRTEGYIPAGAGFSGKTGGGVAGSLIGLGGEAAKGAIQMAADLGKMAASAAAAGATGGAGAAAGPAAGAGIQIAADIAKRGVDWGVDMANIGVGALSEILMPFGAPRWLSDVDATSFMPQMGIQSAATTSVEQMAQQQLQNQLTPQQIAGQAPPMPQAGQHMLPGAQPGVPIAPGPPPGQPNQPPAPSQPEPQGPTPSPTQPLDFLRSFGIFDSGGVLQPSMGAVNLSNRPEYVFTQSQWKSMEANASTGPAGNVTYNVQGVNLDEALRELKKTERRNSGPRMRGKAGLG